MHKAALARFEFDFTSPLICTAIHNGHAMSEAFKQNLGISEADCLREEDPYTDYFAMISTNRIIATTSRFEVDLNRSPDTAVYQEPDDCWGLPVRKQVLSETDLHAAMDAYNDFYAATKMVIEETIRRFDVAYILDLHSYNHQRMGVGKPFDDPTWNPEVIIGTNNMPSVWQSTADAFQQKILAFDFGGRQLDCRQNVKFTGGYFSRWVHHHFGEKACCLAIEFKKIFMDEWTGNRNLIMQEQLRRALYNAASSFQ